MSKNKKYHYAWIVLIGLCLIRSFSNVGINVGAGLYLKSVSDDIGVGIGSLSLYFSISSIVTVLWLPFAGKLVNKTNARLITIIAVILQGGGFALLGVMNSVWGWYILSIPIGMGGAILVNLIGPVLINRWFAKNTGLAIGILMSTGGILGAILQPLTTNIIASRGWRFTYIAIGILVLVVVIISALIFLSSSPQDKNMQAYGAGEVGNPQTDNIQKRSFGVEAAVARKSIAFYLLIIFMIALTGFGAFAQHTTTYGLQLGYSMQTIGMALSFSMIGTAIGAIAIGVVSDKIGILPTSIGMLVIGIVAVILLFISGSTFVIFAIGTFLHGLGSVSIGVLAPLLTGAFFGAKDYESLFSNIMMGPSLASIIILPLYGFIYDALGGYSVVFIVMLAMLVIAFFCLTIGWKNSRKLLAGVTKPNK